MSPPKTTTPRQRFTAAVFARDHGRCVVCADPAVDAHHLIERRLFPDGGYVLDNGVSLCAPCHLKAEQTTLDATTLRTAAQITRVVLPPYFDPTRTYDKWGNELLTFQGELIRLPGPLYYTGSVAATLAPLRTSFRPWVSLPVLATLEDLLANPPPRLAWPLAVLTSASSPETRPVTVTSDYIYGTSLLDQITNRLITPSLRAAGAQLPPSWRWCGQLDPNGSFTSELLFDDQLNLVNLSDTLSYAELSTLTPTEPLGIADNLTTLIDLARHPAARGGLVRANDTVSSDAYATALARIPN